MRLLRRWGLGTGKHERRSGLSAFGFFYSSVWADFWLFTLRQGAWSVADFAVEFGTLAAESGWNKPALLCALWRGLNDSVCDALFAETRPRGPSGDGWSRYRTGQLPTGALAGEGIPFLPTTLPKVLSSPSALRTVRYIVSQSTGPGWGTHAAGWC